MLFFFLQIVFFRMQVRIGANLRGTRDIVAQFLESKQGKLAFENVISQKKKCECSQSEDTQDIPCQCNVDLKRAECCQKDSLRQFVLKQVETYPEVDFYQKMLLKYIEVDIDQIKREAEQRNLEANVCLFAPHVMPVLYELLPMLGTFAERELSMQGIGSLISNVMKAHYSSTKDEMPQSAQSSTCASLSGKNKEELCTESCCRSYNETS